MVYQYIGFTDTCKEQVALFGPTLIALENTIDICVEQGYLTNYLKRRRGELVRYTNNLFDEERLRRVERLAYGRDQKLEGEREKEEAIIRNMLQKGGLTVETIADFVGAPVSQVEAIANGMNLA